MSGVRVCSVAEVRVDQAVRVMVGDVAVAIVRDSEGAIHALGDKCTHGDISLAEGFVEDDTLECWAHGSRFDLKTGRPLTLPAYEPVPVFAVTVVEDDVYVDPVPQRIDA
jgi:3-phenylpropionate/trans-cinnamate dioxygenase ferredoxin component